MPLGVLAVDIDKLLHNRITIPSSSARDFARSPPSTSKHHRTTSASPGSGYGSRRSHARSITPRGVEVHPASPHRRTDCYLIKGDDGTRVWNGVVVPPAASPVSSTPAITPRRKHRRTSPRSSDNGTPFRIEDAAMGPSSALDELPFHVAVNWSPRDAHSTVTIIPSPRHWGPSHNAAAAAHHHSGSSAITPRGLSQPSASPPPLNTMNATSVANNSFSVHSDAGPPTAGGGIMVAPRPGSGSGRENPSRKGSATTTRQGSARTVRVIDHHDDENASEALRAARPPLGKTAQHEGDTSGAPSTLSAVALDIIDTTLSYVKGRVQLMMNPPPRIPQPPSTFPSRDVEARLLAPKRSAEAAVSPRRRVSHGDMIASGDAAGSTSRQRDIIREKERQLANASFRHEHIFQPHCRSLPSTLSTYRPTLHGKKDPMFPAVFDLEYVKPSRVLRAHRSTAERRALAFDTISHEEKAILDILGRGR
jgi:hypothetical protein